MIQIQGKCTKYFKNCFVKRHTQVGSSVWFFVHTISFCKRACTLVQKSYCYTPGVGICVMIHCTFCYLCTKCYHFGLVIKMHLVYLYFLQSKSLVWYKLSCIRITTSGVVCCMPQMWWTLHDRHNTKGIYAISCSGMFVWMDEKME